MAAPRIVKQLVRRFEDNLEAYRSGHYNELQVRLEFIDPLFKALGWDIYNEQGNAEAYKDVVHEAAVKVGGHTKAPDYSFRIGGTRKFFLEAKKPSIDIKGDPHPAFQLRRYAWSGKLPLSILTDFEEFAVYDCRIRPVQTDKASQARIMYMTFRQYYEQWDELYGLFSKDAILKGAFDRFVESSKKKRGTAEVDAAFLKEIETWRVALARNIALRNGDLSQREVNFAVGRTIDRIIFLRICEDRGTEEPNRLMALQNGTNIYRRLIDLYHRADEKYNSGLFHFRKERDRPLPPDELTPKLALDDKVLKDIFKGLYYPESPYEFSVLPADILGQVYEQFLGKVIRLTEGHHAKVEDKPEVRKAGGIYYTPTYIVDYIVKHTVGKLLEGSTPRKAAKLRILDPACGSGSFLLGAYQYLLDWHRDWYVEDSPDKHKKQIYQAGEKEWRLTTAERKRILLNNIYGVDIDEQAVEVTKLSLLLKVLEKESAETINRQLKLLHERALPDLAGNIKCGNSLIGPDFYEGQQISMLDEEERYRINVFDWENEFAEIMQGGGFDAVIGNPPYIQLSMAEYYNSEVNKYLTANYSSSMGRLNTFGFFIEQVLDLLLGKNGYISFIVPNTILTQEYYKHLRQNILKNQLCDITTFIFPVFHNAVVETIILVIRNASPSGNQVRVVSYDNKQMKYKQLKIPQEIYLNTHNSAFIVGVDQQHLALKDKIDAQGAFLKELVYIHQAIALKHDRSKWLFEEKKADNYKPVLDGRNIQRYELNWTGTYLAYDVNAIHSCKRTDIFEIEEKIFFRRVGDRIIATYDNSQFYALNTLIVITLRQNTDLASKYILGLLNSTLMNYYYVNFLKSTKKVFSEIQARQLAQLPIRTIDFSDPADKTRHDKMVQLVERMLALHKELTAARTEHDKTALQRQIDATDGQIDRLVYELYGLTEEEIGIVEGQ